MSDTDCKNRKKEGLTNKEWIKYQLDCNLDREIRDVLLHASFVEGTTIIASERYHAFPCQNEKKGTFRSLNSALTLLEGRVDSTALKRIDDMRVLRNRLIHDIAKDTDFDQNKIEEMRDKMYQLIINIYNDDFIEGEFQGRFDISTKNLPQVRKLANCSLDNIKLNSSDS